MQIAKRFKYFLGGTQEKYEADKKAGKEPEVAVIEVRRPETSERNEYNDRMFPVPDSRKADVYGAGVWLFDTLVVSIENLFDGDTKITLDNKALVPDDLKADIATRVMNRSDIKEVKNF